jgi:hypothetical protein
MPPCSALPQTDANTQKQIHFIKLLSNKHTSSTNLSKQVKKLRAQKNWRMACSESLSDMSLSFHIANLKLLPCQAAKLCLSDSVKNGYTPWVCQVYLQVLKVTCRNKSAAKRWARVRSNGRKFTPNTSVAGVWTSGSSSGWPTHEESWDCKLDMNYPGH